MKTTLFLVGFLFLVSCKSKLSNTQNIVDSSKTMILKQAKPYIDSINQSIPLTPKERVKYFSYEDVKTLALQPIIDTVHNRVLPEIKIDKNHYFELLQYDSVDGGYQVSYTSLVKNKGWSRFWIYYPKTHILVDGITFDTLK